MFKPLQLSQIYYKRLRHITMSITKSKEIV